MSYERWLQQPAVPAHMSEPGEEFRIASSPLGTVEESFHRTQRAALVHLNVRI
jgi:hypothetical protein